MPNRIKVSVSPDKAHATLQVAPDTDSAEPLVFTPDELLELVQRLGRAHQGMIEGREIPSLEGQRVEVVVNTRWAVASERLGEATLFSFQHPAFGPVGFLIPIDQVAQIAERLARQVQQSKASRRKAN